MPPPLSWDHPLLFCSYGVCIKGSGLDTSDGTYQGQTAVTAIRMMLQLEMDLSSWIANGTYYTAQFRTDIAESIMPPMPVDRVSLIGVAAGSMVVTFELLPGAGVQPSAAAIQLLHAQDYSESTFYRTGSLTALATRNQTMSFVVVATGRCADGEWSSDCTVSSGGDKLGFSRGASLILTLVGVLIVGLLLGIACIVCYTRRRGKINPNAVVVEGVEAEAQVEGEPNVPTKAPVLPEVTPVVYSGDARWPAFAHRPSISEPGAVAIAHVVPEMLLESVSAPVPVPTVVVDMPPSSSSRPSSSLDDSALDLATAIARHNQELFESHRRQAEALMRSAGPHLAFAAPSNGAAKADHHSPNPAHHSKHSKRHGASSKRHATKHAHAPAPVPVSALPPGRLAPLANRPSVSSDADASSASLASSSAPVPVVRVHFDGQPASSVSSSSVDASVSASAAPAAAGGHSSSSPRSNSIASDESSRLVAPHADERRPHESESDNEHDREPSSSNQPGAQ